MTTIEGNISALVGQTRPFKAIVSDSVKMQVNLLAQLRKKAMCVYFSETGHAMCGEVEKASGKVIYVSGV